MKNRLTYRRRRLTVPRRPVPRPGAPMSYVLWTARKPRKAPTRPRTKGGDA